MAIVLGGALVMAAFLVTSVLMFHAFLTTSAIQSQSLRDQIQVNVKKRGSGLEITGAVVSNPGNGDAWVHVDNTGSQSVPDFSEMDVILQYTDTSDVLRLTYLAYNPSGVGPNQWTVSATGVQPDSFNPRIWDSDETLTIDLRVSPAIKSGATGQVVVGTPWGVSDQSSITNP